MTRNNSRAILVTGSIRSGSTWVGQMIASHPGIHYVSEPFNTDHAECPARYRFHHVTSEEESVFRDYLRPMVEFKPPLSRFLQGRHVLGSLKHLCRRMLGYRALLKDPHALFSAEWLAETFPLNVVVLIRHPAAFVSSMKRLGWEFHFNHLLEQTALLGDLLAPYEAEMRHLRDTPHTGFDEVVLLWRVVHGVIHRYRQRHSDWIFLRHEDLSRDPVGEFDNLFSRLGLTLTPSLAAAIHQHSSEDNPREARAGVVHQLHRDSKANVWSWRLRLSNDEVLRIRRATEPEAVHFYGDADWGGEPAAA
jgi:hypothetical protein